MKEVYGLYLELPREYKEKMDDLAQDQGRTKKSVIRRLIDDEHRNFERTRERHRE